MLQNEMNPPGGANTVALWMLESIKSEFDVTVLTWDTVNFAAINQFYGTQLEQGDIRVITIAGWIRALVDRVPDPWRWQRYCVLMRKCKQISQGYDLLLSAHDETDFGRRGIQYVHYPFQAENWASEQPRRHFGARLRPWRIISGFSFEQMMSNRTLVNSEWTAEQCRNTYGPLDMGVIYPPVVGAFDPLPWEARENGFVCIGRFAGDKRIDWVIQILSRVRERHPDIQLHLVGTFSPWEDEMDCYRMVKDSARDNAEWIFLHEDISREELISLLCRQRYGIHGKQQEHFGLAIAEMVTAGCIPFIPDDGGQVEIVGTRDELLYGNQEQAVNQILSVLGAEDRQFELRTFLADCSARFTLDAFGQRIRQELNDFPVHTAA
jgi:glycosyltransferase involved in cell wall biosynthesis